MAPWIRIRRELFEQLQRHVQLLLGPETPDLRHYREEFEREFEVSWRPSDREQFLAEVMRSDIVLLGDFHALAQSQRSHLRVLKALPKESQPLLAVEFLEARHQDLIDDYMTGEITEKQFLTSIEWEKNWGFPWENYRPLLRYAQKRGIPVFGLNRRFSERTGKSLRLRDDFAAGKIHELRKTYPGRSVFVIYGDMHLASRHLPKSLEKSRPRREILRILSVFQNSERIYFRLLEREQEVAIDVVRLSRDQFCLVSVPPWVKWQNYLLFLERHLDRGLSGDDFEYTDHVGRYVQVIAADFGLEVDLGSFAVYTPEDEKFWTRLQNHFQGPVLKNFKEMIAESKSFYVPELQIAFLARPSVNHAAQVAMSIVHAQLSGWRTSSPPVGEAFLKLIWLEAVQYFGSKMINPKRKTDTLQDLRAALASRSAHDSGEEALKVALHQKMKELLFLTGQGRQLNVSRPRRISAAREAARLLGGLLGEKLFNGYRKKLISTAAVTRLFRIPVDDPGFPAFYFELLEIIEGLPEPFLSKAEKM